MKTLFPYQTLVGAVVVRKVEAWISTDNGEKRLPSNYVDPERADVLLAELVGDEWEYARIGVAVDIPSDEIATSSDWSELQVVLVGDCGYTNERLVVDMDKDDARGSRWSGELVWSRSRCYGRGHVRAIVLATVGGIGKRPLGESEVWTLDFDKLPANPIHGSIPIVWLDFSEPPQDRPYFRRYAKDPWFMTLDPLTPTLYLNSAFPELAQLLDDEARLKGADTAVRDTLRAGLAAQAWQAMFMYSLASARIDDETGEVGTPDEEWQQSVLSSLLARMYPGRPESDALREARMSLDSAESLAGLQQLLLPASTEQAQGPRLIGDSLKRLAIGVPRPFEEA